MSASSAQDGKTADGAETITDDASDVLHGARRRALQTTRDLFLSLSLEREREIFEVSFETSFETGRESVLEGTEREKEK